MNKKGIVSFFESPPKHSYGEDGVMLKHIYALLRPSEGIIYVGSTISPRERLRDHRWKRKEPKIQMMILEKVRPTESHDREQYWIERLRGAGHELENKADRKLFRMQREVMVMKRDGVDLDDLMWKLYVKMKEKGVSAADIARHTKTSKASLSRYFKGHRAPTTRLYCQMMNYVESK